MPTANCPSCGAPVRFQSAASVLAVCDYCTSTLVKHGAVLEDIGKMAALQDDPTLVQIGTEGVYKGVHFGVIGRIQLSYDAGLWNEWHVMFDDMRTGWLGEAAGEFFLTFEQKLTQAAPAVAGVKVEDRIDIGGRYFEVTDIEEATCIAGQGELPFQVGPGYAAPVVDLRLEGEFATLDYSDAEEEGGPRAFVGERVAARDLKLANLRNPKATDAAAAPTAKADAFNCPSCAAPFQLSSGRIKTFGCASCGAVLDTSAKQVQLVMKAQEAMDTRLLLPLGSRGKFDGIEWTAIGHLRRASEAGFAWSEYLLFNRESGYAWMVESDGHWSLLRNADKPAKTIGTLAVLNKVSHEHFAHYRAEVRHVLGEFYWKVKAGDTVEVDDFIAPPAILSREKNAREVTWSAGRYLPPEEVRGAFGLKDALPAPRGVAPNQPCPWDASVPRLWTWFGIFTVLALTLQLWFAITTQTVRNESATLRRGGGEAVLTAPFKLTGRGNLAISSDTDLDNSWAGLTLTLVDPASGHTWEAEQQLESYSGTDEDGDRWSEGSKLGLSNFGEVPPGTYQLRVEGELAPDAKQDLHVALKLERGHASWLNWLLLQMALLTFPLFGWWRQRAFEAARWADSDHADDDDDD